MTKLRLALTSMLTAAALATSSVAMAADNRAIHKSRVIHSMDAANEAMKRLDYHANMQCETRCARYEMDLVIAKRAMMNLQNYANLALGGKSVGELDLARIDHALKAANEAISRLDYYADRVNDRYRARVSTDVSILDRAMSILGNYARLAPTA